MQGNILALAIKKEKRNICTSPLATCNKILSSLKMHIEEGGEMHHWPSEAGGISRLSLQSCEAVKFELNLPTETKSIS